MEEREDWEGLVTCPANVGSVVSPLLGNVSEAEILVLVVEAVVVLACSPTASKFLSYLFVNEEGF